MAATILAATCLFKYTLNALFNQAALNYRRI